MYPSHSQHWATETSGQNQKNEPRIDRNHRRPRLQNSSKGFFTLLSDPEACRVLRLEVGRALGLLGPLPARSRQRDHLLDVFHRRTHPLPPPSPDEQPLLDPEALPGVPSLAQADVQQRIFGG